MIEKCTEQKRDDSQTNQTLGAHTAGAFEFSLRRDVHWFRRGFTFSILYLGGSVISMVRHRYFESFTNQK